MLYIVALIIFVTGNSQLSPVFSFIVILTRSKLEARLSLAPITTTKQFFKLQGSDSAKPESETFSIVLLCEHGLL